MLKFGNDTSYCIQVDATARAGVPLLLMLTAHTGMPIPKLLQCFMIPAADPFPLQQDLRRFKVENHVMHYEDIVYNLVCGFVCVLLSLWCVVVWIDEYCL